MTCISSISHGVKVWQKSNVPHWKVTCIATSFVSCGSPFANRTLVGLPALPIGKPQLPCEFWAQEGMACLFVNPWDISPIHLSLKVQKTWPRLKATSLGHNANVLHSVRGTSIIWRGTYLPSTSIVVRHRQIFLLGSSALMLMAILMIPATTSMNFWKFEFGIHHPLMKPHLKWWIS